MKSIEKLMSASLAEEELLQLKAGAMEEEAPVDIDLDGIPTNLNQARKCKCGRGDLLQDNYNGGRHCKCFGKGNTTNTVNTCGGLISTNPSICLPLPEPINLRC